MKPPEADREPNLGNAGEKPPAVSVCRTPVKSPRRFPFARWKLYANAAISCWPPALAVNPPKAFCYKHAAATTKI
jgi:hypothetical protein